MKQICNSSTNTELYGSRKNCPDFAFLNLIDRARDLSPTVPHPIAPIIDGSTIVTISDIFYFFKYSWSALHKK